MFRGRKIVLKTRGNFPLISLNFLCLKWPILWQKRLMICLKTEPSVNQSFEKTVSGDVEESPNRHSELDSESHLQVFTTVYEMLHGVQHDR